LAAALSSKTMKYKGVSMEEQELNEDISKEFKTRRKKQYWASIPAIGVFIFVFLMDRAPQSVSCASRSVWMSVLLAYVLGLLIFSLTNWRCPACHGYLGKRINPRFCSKCGVRLRP
jgi:hypothetical protein